MRIIIRYILLLSIIFINSCTKNNDTGKTSKIRKENKVDSTIIKKPLENSQNIKTKLSLLKKDCFLILLEAPMQFSMKQMEI